MKIQHMSVNQMRQLDTEALRKMEVPQIIHTHKDKEFVAVLIPMDRWIKMNKIRETLDQLMQFMR